MNKRKIIFFTSWLVLLLFLILPYMANAAGTLMQKEETLCQQFQDKIKINQEIGKVVRTSIQMGYGVCGVIKCAIKGGGDLKQIIEGAVEAGTTKDVVSRCALDAGADAKDIAVILGNISANGVYYLLLEDPEIIVPPLNPDPKQFLSPSHF